MGKHRFKTIRLFLKLVLIFQIYSHHCFKAKATEKKIPGSFIESKVSEEPDNGLSLAERPKRPARSAIREKSTFDTPPSNTMTKITV